MPKLTPARCRLFLWLFLAGLTAFRIYYIQAIPISEDEANSWQWARHLDWGYFDQGPLLAWVIWPGIKLFGSNPLGIRIGAVLLSLGSSLLLYGFCRRIFKDEALGLSLVLAANLSIFFTAGAVIHTYDAAQIFFWLLALYGAALALFEEKTWAWYLAGAACGLAGLAKYSSALLPVLIFAYLALSRHRFWLRRPQPWLGAGLALLITLPNIWWNAAHHWAAFGHTAGLMQKDLVFTTFEMLAGQAGLLGPVWFGLLVWGLVLAWRQARQGDDVLAFLLWSSLPVLAFFTLLSMKSRVPPNWPAPGYLGAILAAAPLIKERFAASRKWRGWVWAGFVSSALLLALALCHAPVIRALDINPDADPTNKLYGWEGLGPAMQKELDRLPEPKPFIFGLRYQTASLAAYYLPGQPRTVGLFLPGNRLNCYVFWQDPCKLKGKDGLGLVIGTPKLGPYFKKVRVLRKLSLRGPGGEVYHRLNLVLGESFSGCDGRPADYRQDGCCQAAARPRSR